MKITDTENVKNIIIPQNQKTVKNGKQKFDEILNKKMQNATTARSENKTTPTVKQPPPLLFNPPSDREEVVSLVSQFLDIMEEYSVQLSSSKTSLKELAPLVSRMQTETENMKQLSAALPPGDGIKEILDETLIRSSVEVIKFNRGDYI